jgi:hypothetical protein
MAVCMTSYAQDKKTEPFVVYTMSTDTKDIRYDVYRNCNDAASVVNELIKDGRYVKSIVNTEFGLIVLHCSNTANMEQKYATVELADLKNVANKFFKDGYAVDYYNKNGGYALFKKDSEITKQNVLSSVVSQSQLNKLNKQGLFIVVDNYNSVVVQNGQHNVEQQVIGRYSSMYRLVCDSFSSKALDGWTVGALGDNYDSKNDSYSYSVVYNKVNPLFKGRQEMIDFVTEERLNTYLARKLRGNYYIFNIWGGGSIENCENK